MAASPPFGSTPLVEKVISGPIISADSHITEPPGTYIDRIDSKLHKSLSVPS